VVSDRIANRERVSVSRIRKTNTAEMPLQGEHMPFIGLGLHVFVAIFFAVHAIRRGRDLYWLLILFSFPLLGSIAYFLVVYLPETRLEHGIRKATVAAVKTLDPGKTLREAQRAFDLTPTAQNQMRLAYAFLDAGGIDQAAKHFEACLQGPFANDPEIRVGAAKTYLQQGNSARAIEFLESVQNKSPDFRPEAVALLLAQAYTDAGRREDAGRIYADAVRRFGSIDTKVEYAIWALGAGDADTATSLKQEIDHAAKHWNKHVRSMNRPLVKRLEAAFATRS
jgi:hypothetical protein